MDDVPKSSPSTKTAEKMDSFQDSDAPTEELAFYHTPELAEPSPSTKETGKVDSFQTSDDSTEDLVFYQTHNKEKVHGNVQSDDIDEDETVLEKAFRALRDNVDLTTEQESAILKIVDHFTTCSLNPWQAMVQIEDDADISEGEKIVKIVKYCQTHHHTKTCRKSGTDCRFNFPRWPMWKSLLTHEVNGETQEEKEKKDKSNKKVLKSVADVLEDNQTVTDILNKYDIESEDLDQYTLNRKKRIVEVLQLAYVTEEEYEAALVGSSKRGVTVLLARDLGETDINNYNAEWIRAWNGNLDLQIVLDFFSVITYITEYFTKDDTGTTSFLKEAAKNVKHLPQSQQRNILKNVFLTHRQMGQFEAYMKIIPSMHMKDSNIGVEYVPLGRKEDISRYLVRANEEFSYPKKELFEIESREGLYYERPNMIEKYLRRSSDLKGICLAQFAKMYDPTHKDQEDTGDETIKVIGSSKEQMECYQSDEEMEFYQDDNSLDIFQYKQMKEKHGQDAKLHFLIKPDGSLGKVLPKMCKLNDPLPGEPPFMKKRETPKSIRFYKAKNDENSTRYFLHELLLYHSFDDKIYQGWCRSDESCTTAYLEGKDQVQRVKAHVMPWITSVDQARHYVEEVLKNQVDTEKVGAELDPEKEHADHICEEEGIEDDPAFYHLNPEDHLEDSCLNTAGPQLCKRFRLEEDEILKEKTQQLDDDQMLVLTKAIAFAREVVKSRKPHNVAPKAPLLVVTGGAGSGKSNVIEVVSQWVTRILVSSGDDPDSPVVLKTATTGAASTLIDGVTLHSAMSFDFANRHCSLTDKRRELKRSQMENTRVIIVDEYSMLKSDLLYRLDLKK